MPLSALISAGASLAGGLFGRSQADKAAKRQEALQREFAQHGIRWKVADAKAAGIHPLAALGAQTTSFAPQSVGDPLPGALATAGQDIGRAVNAMRTPDEKVTAYEQALRQLQLQRGQLENTLLASKIRTLNQAGNPPGLPGGERLQDPQRQSNLRTPEGIVVSNPRLSDAQAFQDRYGEWGENIYGFRNWAAEIGDEALRRAWENERQNFGIGLRAPWPERWRGTWHPFRR